MGSIEYRGGVIHGPIGADRGEFTAWRHGALQGTYATLAAAKAALTRYERRYVAERTADHYAFMRRTFGWGAESMEAWTEQEWRTIVEVATAARRCRARARRHWADRIAYRWHAEQSARFWERVAEVHEDHIRAIADGEAPNHA
jgi:hypothetical protein